MKRSSINEIIPGKLFQRGQILTWQREVKLKFLREHGITTIVNFWPKIDPDFSDFPLNMYLYLPSDKSNMMLEKRISLAASFIAKSIKQGEKCLIMCEAGVTRSVFFCILVIAKLEELSLSESYNKVKEKIPGLKLKSFMLEFLGVE